MDRSNARAQRRHAEPALRGNDRVDGAAIDTISAQCSRDEALLFIGETKLPDRRNRPETARGYSSGPLTTEFGHVGTHHQHDLSAGLPELSRQCSAASSSLGLNLDLMEG